MGKIDNYIIISPPTGGKRKVDYPIPDIHLSHSTHMYSQGIKRFINGYAFVLNSPKYSEGAN